MKERIFSAVVGAVGGVVSYCFGGWTIALQTLTIFIVVDYVMGLIVAGIFKKSTKTTGGALESRAGFKGLCKKGVTLLIVLVACQLDKVIGSTFIKDAVVITFITNETISIIENAGLMGVPIPPIIMRAIEILNKKGDEK